MDVNYSIPVTMFDFKEEKNSLYSSAKLKIFYVGTTGDKRTFTQKFSDNLLKTLPYVPVVGFYNEKDEDFEGHKPEVQYIYGIVPENAVIEYIEEDSKKYAVSDVILYTGRLDKTGEIAKKIVGKSHSLELNPADTKYKINRDADGKFIDLEFTAGSLLGLSVLGDDEKPAFSGSEFFGEDENIQKIFKNLQEFANIKRGENMELKRFKEFSQFIQLTYEEKERKIAEALASIYGEFFYIEQLFEDKVVVGCLDEDYNFSYQRVKYNFINDEEIEFSISEKVIKRFFTEEEIEEVEKRNEFENLEDPKTMEKSEEIEEEPIVQTTEMEEGEEEAVTVAEEHLEEVFVEGEGDIENEKNQEEYQEGEDNDSTTLSESERIEFEALKEEVGIYRRRDKEELINSFRDDLAKAFIEDLILKIDEFSLEEVDLILSKEFTRIRKSLENKNSSTIIPFSDKTRNGVEPIKETREEVVRRLVETYK